MSEFKSRKKSNVAVNMVIAYNMRNNGIKLKEIAKFINKDHSTVSYLIRRCKELIKLKDKLIIDTLNSLYNDFGANI